MKHFQVSGWFPKPALMVVIGLLALGTLGPMSEGQTGKKKKADKGGVVVDQLAPGVPGQKQVNYINEELERLWRDNNVIPSDRCSDYTFIRRASLDIIGRIAKVEEIHRFMSDPPETRRSMLIERLLKSDEYAKNFANVWTTLLMTRGTPKQYREQMNQYLLNKFMSEDCDWSKVANELVTATGVSDKNGAVNFVLAHLGEKVPQNDQPENGRFDMVPVTSRTTKLFLGLQTQCTQCHDHPFWPDVWQQKHFWGVNAFFRQVDAPQGGIPTVAGQKKKKGFTGQKELKDNPGLNKRGIIPYERRSGTLFYTRARFLDGSKVPQGTKKTRRQVFADFIVDSPYFSKAFVNRMWGHFMGISFTKNHVADFGNHNPVVTPKLREGESKDWLLGRLGKDWTKHKYNPRDLIRWICNSKAYSLSSVANKSNGTRDAEPFFARMMLKAMTPEQLFESLMVATQYQGASNSDERKKLKEQFLNRLVVNFGDDEGNEQTFNGTVVQALLLMNGQDINKAIMDEKNGTVSNVLKQVRSRADAIKAMNFLYLSALNRPVTGKEVQKILNPKMIMLPRVRPPNNPTETMQFWTAFYQDLYWAILNSGEFFLNH